MKMGTSLWQCFASNLHSQTTTDKIDAEAAICSVDEYSFSMQNS